tara:strand:+ start:55 stop:570 length:516 start_codon:yes stop_codon:yes gene_type:complete
MKFKNLQNILGELIVERAQLELGTTRTLYGRKVRRVASDKLRKGLSFSVNGKKLNFNTNQNYGVFIHYGVNGTKTKYGSTFSYGSKQPPLEPILQWMKIKGVRVRKANGGFDKQTPQKVKGLAFAIARKVKERGIAPLPYYDIAIGHVLRTKKDLIEKAVVKEIELQINFD